MPIKIILLLAATHFVADFVCQSDWMAINKSKNLYALLAHTYTYWLVLMLACILCGLKDQAWARFTIVTFVSHTAIDAVTSRITSYLWAKEKRHWFFVTIGFDQLLHTVQLVLTYKWLVK